MRRAAAFLALALLAFVAPYLVTEREAFFPRARAGPDLAACQRVVREFLAALPDAYRSGRLDVLADRVAGPQALAPIVRDLRFLTARGRRQELALQGVDTSAATERDGLVRVRTRERWTVREHLDETPRAFQISGGFLVDPHGPRIVAWEIRP